MNMSDENAQIIAQIRQMHASLEESTYYDLLGVPQDADKKAINGAFRQLAKMWHVDRYSKYELGDDKGLLQAIFSKINEAHRTLSNDASRQEYDDILENGEEEETDVVAILESENLFLRGKNTLNRGGYKGAYEMFREANELNPDDIDIYAHLLYSEYLLIPKNDDGKPLEPARANDIYKELDTINEEVKKRESDWLHVFVGVIAQGVGKQSRAKAHFSEALMLNPNNRDAQRQKRLLNMRKDKQETKSFLDKLLEKLGVTR